MSLRQRLAILDAFQPRWRFWLLVGLSVVVAALEAAGVYLLYLIGVALTGSHPAGPAAIIDAFAARRGIQPLVAVSLLVLAVTLLRSAARLGQERLATSVMLDLIRTYTERLFAATFGLPYEEFLQHSTTERINVMTVEADRAGTTVLTFTRIVGNFCVLAMLVAALLLVDWRAFLFGLLGAAVLAGLMQPMLRAARDLGKEKGPAGRALWSSIADPLRAYKAVVSYGAEGRMLDRLRGHYDTYGALLWRLGWAQRIIVPTLETGVAVFVVVGVLASLHFAGSVQAAAPIVILLMLATYRLLPTLQQLFTNVGLYRYNLPGYEHVRAELARLDRSGGAHAVRLPPGADPGLVLQMSDVRFAYAGGGAEVLRGVDLRIGHGERIGIVGPSGSGKTTLVDLLLGLLRPSAGNVALGVRRDGKPAVLAYVPQDSIILDATLLENLDLGARAGDVDAARAAKALDQVGLGPSSPHPVPLDRPLAEGGARVSGGQRQRIGLARALYRQPDVLLLDEPTSSLDDATEEHVVDTLKGIAGTAMVLVTHRTAPLSICDRVYRLTGGRLVEEKRA